MEKFKFTSIPSTSCRARHTRTSSTECVTDPPINQDIRFSGVINNDRHPLSNQMPSLVIGNEISRDWVKVSREINESSKGPESIVKHMGSN